MAEDDERNREVGGPVLELLFHAWASLKLTLLSPSVPASLHLVVRMATIATKPIARN